MKKLLLLVFMSFFFQVSFSQQEPVLVPLDSVMAAYDGEVMWYNPTMGKYMIGSTKRSVGWFNQNLKKELENSPNALALFKKYRTKQWRGAVTSIGSMVGMFAVVAITGSPFALLFFIPYTIGSIDMLTGAKYLYMSIWQYNRDELEKRLGPSK